MKKFLIILLTIVLSCNFLVCFGSDDFDYGIDKSIDKSVSDVISIHDNTTGIVKTTSQTIDFVPVFNRTVAVPNGQNASALIRSFCDLKSDGYNSSALLLDSYCGNTSNYTLTVSGDKYSLSVMSDEGEVAIVNIPPGEFSAHIKSNNDDDELNCSTRMLAYGLASIPEEGFNINLTCYDKDETGKKTNMWYWLGPVIAVIGAGAIGGGVGGGIAHKRGITDA